jgi:hypothetical protein
MVCVAGTILLSSLAGCLQPVQKVPTTPPPTFTLTELISKVDSNTENLKRFRSKGGRMTTKILTDKGLKQYDLDGVVILYENPRNMYLSGGFLGHPALQIGSNQEKYWLGVMHDPSRLYWGYWKFADAECNEWKMGGPMKLMEAIGQVNLRNLEGKLLGPVLRRNKDANVLMYMAVDDAGNWYIAKEILLSQYEPIVVNKITYYNADSSEYLIISFFDYKQSGPGTLMARRVELNWPADQGYMKLTMGRPRQEKSFPEAAFVMPDPATFNDVTQVDSKCK